MREKSKVFGRPLTRLVLGVFGFFLIILAPGEAESAGHPFWTEQATFQWGNDLYFVGQASCASTAEDGRERAFQNAVRELLNFAQRESAKGLMIQTQMIFEEPNASGCPANTVTVWRLLRLEAAELTASAREDAGTKGHEAASPSRTTTLPSSSKWPKFDPTCAPGGGSMSRAQADNLAEYLEKGGWRVISFHESANSGRWAFDIVNEKLRIDMCVEDRMDYERKMAGLKLKNELQGSK